MFSKILMLNEACLGHLHESSSIYGRFGNRIFRPALMIKKTTPILEQALKAFTYHHAVTLTKTDGQQIAEGYILIMYGDVAFRIQDIPPGRDSHFVSVSDIDQITIRESTY
jgi:hypothetical protein